MTDRMWSAGAKITDGRKKKRITSSTPFVLRKPNMDCPGIEPGLRRCEAGDYSPRIYIAWATFNEISCRLIASRGNVARH